MASRMWITAKDKISPITRVNPPLLNYMYTVAKSSDSVNAHDLTTIQYYMRCVGTAAAFGLQHTVQNKQELEIKHSRNIFGQNEIESWSSNLNLSRPTAFNQSVHTEKSARGNSKNSHVNEIKKILRPLFYGYNTDNVCPEPNLNIEGINGSSNFNHAIFTTHCSNRNRLDVDHRRTKSSTFNQVHAGKTWVWQKRIIKLTVSRKSWETWTLDQ